MWTDEASTRMPTIVTQEQLLENKAAFKETLKLPASELRKNERETKEPFPIFILVFCT